MLIRLIGFVAVFFGCVGIASAQFNAAQIPARATVDDHREELSLSPKDFRGRVLDIREALKNRYPNLRLRRTDLVAIRIWAKTPTEAELVLEVGRRFRTSKVFMGSAETFSDRSKWSYDAFTLTHAPVRSRGDWWLTRLGEVDIAAIKVRLARAERGPREDNDRNRGAKKRDLKPFEVAVSISDCRGDIWQSKHNSFVFARKTATHATFVSTKYGIPQKCKGYRGTYNEQVSVDVPLGRFDLTAQNVLAIPRQVTNLKCVAKETRGKAIGCVGVAGHNAN